MLNTSSDSNGNTSNGPQQPPPVPPRSFEKSFDDDFMGYDFHGSMLVNFAFTDIPWTHIFFII